MKRRTFITTLALGSAGLSVRALGKTSGATFVVAHGAWSAGWAWKKMHSLLTAAGHRLFTPTYTGLGERAHLADPSNSLETEAAAAGGDGWRVPSNPIPSDTSEADREWIEERRGPQAIKSFETPLHSRHGETKLPRHYIYCKRAAPGDVFRQFADRARREGWGYFEMDASHSPFITAPEALTTILDTIARTA